MSEKVTTWEQDAPKWVRHGDNPTDKYTMLVGHVASLIARHVSPCKTLDVGCGPGVLSSRLAERGFDVYGTDISRPMLDAAAARLAGIVDRPDERFRVCADGDVPFADHRFGLITAIQMMSYVADQPAFIDKLSSLLAPGGVVVATGTNRLSLWTAHEILSRMFRLPPHVRTIRNLARTGYHSGGFVDLATARQTYCASRFDRMFVRQGFTVVDTLDYYHVRALDRDPFGRGRMGKWLARHLCWHHVGVFRKA